MVAALTSIGPAVFNGGISTLIAIIMLISSQSHVFISYFKVSFVNIFFSNSDRSHCLGISYYVNFLGGLGSNEFHIKVRFGTHGS